MYKLRYSKSFLKQAEKLCRRDKLLEKRLQKTLKHLMQGARYPSLRTHKVNVPNFGLAYASYVTGDIRILWNFSKDQDLTIELKRIGGHEGGRKIYK